MKAKALKQPRVNFRTSEVAELIRPLLRNQTVESLVCHDASAIRGIYCILHGESQLTELRRADRVFSAMGRPDLFSLLQAV